jgi:hypothetical protein
MLKAENMLAEFLGQQKAPQLVCTLVRPLLSELLHEVFTYNNELPFDVLDTLKINHTDA